MLKRLLVLLRDSLIYGVKRSFFPGSYRDKRAYVRQVIDYYDRVVAAEGTEPAPAELLSSGAGDRARPA